MLETINDYISIVVLIILVFGSLRLFSATFSMDDDEFNKKRESILFDYQNNEDE